MRWRAIMIVLCLVLGVAHAHAQTTLRVFAGGSAQRPDLTKKLLALYMQRNPGVRVETEAGGATSDLQRQYLC
jgi:multiple sugar transport system substrate-binding protein